MLRLTTVLELEKRLSIDKTVCQSCHNVDWIPILDKEQFSYCLDCARILINKAYSDRNTRENELKKLEKMYELALLKVN
jgi:uncharacterized paraquat-inducible protein A